MAEAEGGSVYFKRTKDSLKNKISWGLNITSSRVLLYFVSAELREISSNSSWLRWREMNKRRIRHRSTFGKSKLRLGNT